MLHAMFRLNQSTGSREEDFLRIFTIYAHGSHLGPGLFIYIHWFPLPTDARTSQRTFT